MGFISFAAGNDVGRFERTLNGFTAEIELKWLCELVDLLMLRPWFLHCLAKAHEGQTDGAIEKHALVQMLQRLKACILRIFC